MGIIMKAVIVNLAICLLLLSACNTLHGLGKDIKATGEQLESVTGSN